MTKILVIIFVLVQLVSCASIPNNEKEVFNLQGREGLYEKDEWSFLGRIALTGKNNAISASVKWQHNKNEETIVLSGVFGLGRTKIVLRDGQVFVNMKGEAKVYSGDVNKIISGLLGVEVPVTALKYWVLGVVDPKADYKLKFNGFEQHEWQVTYKKMLGAIGKVMPVKMKAERESARVKLIVKQWNI